LENYTQLYANPGKFYHALTLLERNLPGDKQQVKILLEQVVQNYLGRQGDCSGMAKKMVILFFITFKSFIYEMGKIKN
jgi:hypothetical protein